MARRTIAVSRDEVFGERLAAALAAAGCDVQLERAVPAEVSDVPALWVVHHSDAGALPAIPGTVPIVVVLEPATLEKLVDVMQATERVVGAVAAAGLDAGQLSALVARVGAAEPFGLARHVPAGTQIHQRGLRDHDDKQQALAEIRAFAAAAGAPDSQCDAIEQCVDELLMNAIYDAPVDARGRALFEGKSVRERIERRTDQTVTLEYAVDGQRLVIAVRDVFGRLGRGTMLRHLHKGLHAKETVEHKRGGAGLGLYLIATSASALSFTVRPHAGTQATCVFQLGRGATASQLDFIELPAADKPRAARVIRTPAAQRAFLFRVAAVSLVLGLVATAIFAPPFPSTGRLVLDVTPVDAQVELDGRAIAADARRDIVLSLARAHHVRVHRDGYEPMELDVFGRLETRTMAVALQAVATVEVDSQPTDARVSVDGVAMGSTPLKITSLAPAASVTLTFDKAGYKQASAKLQVPRRGAVARHMQPLERSEAVRVRIVSTPLGARVTRTGEPLTVDRTYTPADVYVEPDRPQRFTLTMEGRVPLNVDVVAKRGDDGVVVGGDLSPAP